MANYQIIDAHLYLNDIEVTTSTSEERFLGLNGDTIRITKNRTPSSSTDTGYKGEICWDSSYVYLCVDTNSWKRIGLSSF